MLMPKKNRRLIYEELFKEGVMVAKKDFSTKHQLDVPNLHVIKSMQSLRSRGFVEEQFAWRHYYWRLTNEGLEYLRALLHLPNEIVPNTLKHRRRAPERSAAPMDSRRPPMGMGGVDRDSREIYRRTGEEQEKQASVGIGSQQVEFRGGFGRGRPM